MNLSVVLNWKSFAALGGTALGIICVAKIDSDAVERVLVHAINAFMDYSIALKGN